MQRLGRIKFVKGKTRTKKRKGSNQVSREAGSCGWAQDVTTGSRLNAMSRFRVKKNKQKRARENATGVPLHKGTTTKCEKQDRKKKILLSE